MVVVYNSAEGILHGGIARLDYICWTNVEMTTAITCANLPAMSSLIRQFSRKRIKNSQAYKTTVGKLPSNFSSRWNLLHGQMLSVVRTGRKKDDSSLQQDMLEKGSDGVDAAAKNSASKSNGDSNSNSNSDGFTGGYYSPTSPKKGEEEGAYSSYTTSTTASSAAPGTTDINHSASSASGKAKSPKHMPITEFRREHPERIAYASATTTTTITTTAEAGAAGAAVASATSRDRGGGGATKGGINKNDTSWLEPKTEIYNDDDDYDNEPLV